MSRFRWSPSSASVFLGVARLWSLVDCDGWSASVVRTPVGDWQPYLRRDGEEERKLSREPNLNDAVRAVEALII